MDRDFQITKFSKWEFDVESVARPKNVRFENAQMFIDGIYLAEGLLYPPKVKPLSKTAKVLGKANRNSILLPENSTTFTVLHELAHSITMTFDYTECHKHDEHFVGVYMKLLDKYLGVPLALQMYVATKHGIKYDLAATQILGD